MGKVQKDIVNGAKQYAEYIVSHILQKGEDGNIRYYFSGSLAMLLLNSAKCIKPQFLNESGKIKAEQEEFFIPEKNKTYLERGIRPIGLDVDVIEIEAGTFEGKGGIYQLGAIRENCNLATSLCPQWERGAGAGYFDWLAGDRSFVGYDIAELTLEDNTKVAIADPLCLILHKFADAIKCQTIICNLKNKGKLTPQRATDLKKKYAKDARDFSSMFNGVVGLYTDVNFEKFAQHLLDVCPQTAFTDIMQSESMDLIKAFYDDAMSEISNEYQGLFKKFINAMGTTNKDILRKQAEASARQPL